MIEWIKSLFNKKKQNLVMLTRQLNRKEIDWLRNYLEEENKL